MKGVILAAKKTKGLDPVTETTPVGLLPIGNSSLIHAMISRMQAAGVEDVIVVSNHLKEEYKEEFKRRTNVNLVEQKNLNGTADALKQVDFIDDEFIVVNGDTFVSHRDIKSLSSIPMDIKVGVLASESHSPEKFGVLSVTGNEINEIREKPETPENILVNTGAYKLESDIFDYLEENKNLVECVNNYLENVKGEYRLVKDYWIDIGDKNSYLKANEVERSNLEGKISQESQIHDSAIVTDGSVVKENVKIGPKAVVKNNSYIAEGAEIGSNTVISNSYVGENSVLLNSHLEGSVVMENTIIDPFSFVESTLLGPETLIESNITIKNEITEEGSSFR